MLIKTLRYFIGSVRLSMLLFFTWIYIEYIPKEAIGFVSFCGVVGGWVFTEYKRQSK